MKLLFRRTVAGLISAALALSSFAQSAPVSSYGYDAAGRLSSMSEPNGQAHGYAYNVFGELSQHAMPNPSGAGTLGLVGFGRDGQGQVVAVSDPRGLTTAYGIDGLGRLQSQSSPDTGATSAVSDVAGNVTSVTDARGVTVTTAYDLDNRPTSVNYGDSVVSLGYSAGLRTSMTDASGSTAWTRDKLGRVTAKSQVTGGVTLGVSYSYLPGGRISSITYPSGQVVGFSYDGANVASITVNGVTVISGVSYFPFGAPKSWTMGAIGSYGRTVDTHGRITSHTSETGTRALTWDASSRLTAVAETGQAPRTYGWDGLNRLTSANESVARGYGYDLTGNRTSETRNGESYGHTVASASNRLLGSVNESGARSYVLDAVGNTTSDGTRSFAYNNAGQLTQVSTAAGVIAQYAYNGDGRRVKKTSPQGTRLFVYAEDGVSLMGEYTATGAPVVETVYLGSTPVLALQGGAAYFILPDHLDTPRVIKNSAGATVWRWQSDAFGNGAANDNPSGLFQFTFNQRLPGQQFDAETGLHYNHARYYDPAVGRYIASDPIGLAGGINTYAYVEGNPLGYVDPLGLDRWGAETAPAVVLTFQAEGKSLFYDPFSERLFVFDTRSQVARSSEPGAAGPYSGEVTYCETGILGKAYGTAKMRTTDPRSRWIHGGGSGLPDSYAPEQGWVPTKGCTRGQNRDVQTLCGEIAKFRATAKNRVIVYRRD